MNVPAPSQPSRPRLPAWLPPLLVVAATVVAYWPVYSAGFVWNDSDYVTASTLRSFRGLGRIWCDIGATEQYYPLLHSAFWVQQKLWGDDATCYHIMGVALHATNACLFALLLRQLAVPGAWLAAALFALHPVCVESVAWIAEQKNTLSLAFYLGAACVYRPGEAERGALRYWTATALFVAALLTKSLTATLPAALLVIAWWRHGALAWRRDIRSLVLWFAIGAAFSLFSAWVEHAVVGAATADIALDPGQRVLLAGRVGWFYLGKLIWPAGLSFIYPKWTVAAGDPRWWCYALATAALLLACGTLRRHTRAPLAAALLFGGSLVPVAGFFNLFGFSYSFVADHWQYLPSLAAFAFAAAGISRIWLGPAGPLRPAGITMVTVLLLGLGSLSQIQTHLYRDIVTFYRTIQQTNPSSWMPFNNLGQIWLDQGKIGDAIPQFTEAIRLAPNLIEPRNNLAMAFEKNDRLDEACKAYDEALRIKPDSWEVLYNLGNTQRRLGRRAEAIASYRLALRYNPAFAFAHYNLAITLREIGRAVDARGHYEQARRLDPSLPEQEF